MQNLSILEQEFAILPQSKSGYIDGTELLAQLMNAARFLFLARPRHFGKSSLISTLAEIYRGNRALFQGLWIADQLDWQPLAAYSHP